MKVIAAEGLKVPTEANPREYITTEAVEIEPTSYYLRRLADAELVEVDDEGKPIAVAQTAVKKGKAT